MLRRDIFTSLKCSGRLTSLQRDACSADGTLVASLSNSVLTDAKGRIGAIVANRQFQFDGPPAQAGSIYTGGWSVCNNGSLALGPSTIFYQCQSGSFYNLYDRAAGASCQQVLITVIPCGSSGAAAQGADGQPTAASASKPATQIGDGQVQASSAATRVTQIGDGQIQASSAKPKPVSQFSDGQIQVTASATMMAPKVTQIGDGQIQASKASSSAPKVTQISDGQIQATKAATSSAAKVSQATDGQVQVSSATKAPVSQATEGQIQATAASTAKPSTTPAQVTTNAGSMVMVSQFLACVVAAVAVIAL
jgi:hypothetical protein